MSAKQTEPVEPEVVPAARPWPWAGRQTARLRRYAPGERRLMTFFLIFTVAVLLAIAGVSIALLDGFRPPLLPAEFGREAPAPSGGP